MRQKYGAVGTCIFCRDFVGPYRPGDLTDEHVLAYSLGGSDVLPKATCKYHQDITTRLDDSIAREWLNVARHVVKLPSRSRSDWKPTYRIEVTPVAGPIYFIDVPVDQLPRLYIYENLLAPGILIGAPPLPFRGSTICFPENDKALSVLVERLPRGYKASFTSDTYTVGQLDRMLAKVAHTYLTGELGYGNFVATLLDVIEGDVEGARFFVGGYEPPAPQEVCSFSLREDVVGDFKYAVVSISIRSLSHLPKFQVVAGRIVEPAPFPERSRRAREETRIVHAREKLLMAKKTGLFGQAKKK